MIYSLISFKYLISAAIIVCPLLCGILLKAFSGKLPKDHGREFAVDGAKSAGKIRGAGIVFVIAFIIAGAVFASVKLEYIIYYALILLSMLTGYLDDRSDKPWNEYKKGILDLLIAVATSACFIFYNRDLLSISFFGHTLNIHFIVFGIISTVLVWMLINAVNCSDGIDGFCTCLTSVSLISGAVACRIAGTDNTVILLVALMLLVLMPYLWKNANPSTMMMGDAGSRALGLFLTIVMLKTGNILLVIPMCFMVCLDGLLGIAKVSLIRFLHINAFKNIRTPLHDHFRKNKGWSNSQVIIRYCIIQIVISAVTVMLMLK